MTGICSFNRNVFEEEEYAAVNIMENGGNHGPLPNRRQPSPTKHIILVENETTNSPPYQIGRTSSPKPGRSGQGSKNLKRHVIQSSSYSSYSSFSF